MIAGAAKAEIVPQTAVELSGFAARQQPMTGVLDPIHAKALYLEYAGKKLLWMTFDLLSLSGEFVGTFRTWAANELGIANVLLCATHTHAAPAVVELTGCGTQHEQYQRLLQSRAQVAAKAAVASAVDAQIVFVQCEFPLAIDRRGKPSAHVDSTLSALGWKRRDGSFIATVLNYPMHPVSLGHVNRQISADWCGGADRAMSAALPGAPVNLITNGACGNLNPPARPVPIDQCDRYGRDLADAIVGDLVSAKSSREALRIVDEHVCLPLDALTPEQIDATAALRMNEFENTAWGEPFRKAISTWRQTQKTLIGRGQGATIDVELFVVDLGAVIVVAISGELFSRFAALLRERISKPLFVVGYSNAVFGYIPTSEAYDEGGYEVEQAHFFYNSFRPKRGGLEMLAERALELSHMSAL